MNDVKSFLTIAHSVTNYEKTIQTYQERMRKIGAMIQQDFNQIQWLDVFNEVLDMLSENIVARSYRDEEYAKQIDSDLQTLDILQQITEAEIKAKGLTLGSSYCSPPDGPAHHDSDFQATTHFIGIAIVDDIRTGLQVIRNYKDILKGTAWKFQEIKQSIATTRWDLMGIVHTVQRIFEIIDTSSTAEIENASEAAIMNALEKIALSFEGAMHNLETLKSLQCEFDHHHEYQLGTRLELGFSDVVGIFNAVITGARAVMDIQNTIGAIGTKFQLLSRQLHALTTIADWRQIPMKLLEIIATFESQDSEKLKQDLFIKNEVGKMNLFMDGVMGRLDEYGISIV